MSLSLGQILDRKYRIVRLIGEGGMGSVFEGENSLIRRRVAIKVLHATASADPATLTRFEREAQAAGRIGSDHILEVLDLGMLEDGDRYMVMEYLDGEPLSGRVQRLGALSPRQVVPLIRQALVGLGAAHAAGIVHRDLKPDNIFILNEKAGHKDFVKIIDFGISKFGVLGGDMSMTRTGAVMGTPYYMAPEQAKGASDVDARTDLYAIGVILFECLTGHVPFDGNSFNELMFKIVLSDAPALPDSVEPGFRELVKRAMAREPNERFQTAQDFIAALDAWSHGAPVHDQPLGLPAAGVPNPRTLSDGSNENDLRGTVSEEAIAAQRGSYSGVGAAPQGAEFGASMATAVPATTLHQEPRLGAQTGGNWAATQGDQPEAASQSSSGRGLWIGVAAGVVAIAAGAFFFIGSGGEEKPLVPEAGGPAAAAPPEPAPEPVKPAEPEPVAPVAVEPEKPAVVPEEKPDVSESLAKPSKPVTVKPAPAKPVAVKPAPAKPAAPAPTPAKPKKPAATDFGY